MPSDNANKENTPLPVEKQTADSSDDGAEPAGWTMTEEEIREIEASGITLQDVMRELKLDRETE